MTKWVSVPKWKQQPEQQLQHPDNQNHVHDMMLLTLQNERQIYSFSNGPFFNGHPPTHPINRLVELQTKTCVFSLYFPPFTIYSNMIEVAAQQDLLRLETRVGLSIFSLLLAIIVCDHHVKEVQGARAPNNPTATIAIRKGHNLFSQ